MMVENRMDFSNEVMFGFWPEPTSISWSAGRIDPLPNHEETVEKVLSLPGVESGWYKSNDGAFSLQPTHIAKLDGSVFDYQGANFIIALIGMLRGLRLQREDWQHLSRTPVETEKLCDFNISDEEMKKAIQIATLFWSSSNPKVRNLAFGTLHWHLFAQTYKHDFERFNAQYMALDACHELAQKSFPGFTKADTHAKRALWMCSQLRLKFQVQHPCEDRVLRWEKPTAI